MCCRFEWATCARAADDQAQFLDRTPPSSSHSSYSSHPRPRTDQQLRLPVEIEKGCRVSSQRKWLIQHVTLNGANQREREREIYPLP